MDGTFRDFCLKVLSSKCRENRCNDVRSTPSLHHIHQPSDVVPRVCLPAITVAEPHLFLLSETNASPHVNWIHRPFIPSRASFFLLLLY